ncbi:MAG: amidase [Deltaproteobacteria bacterium]|nr:amidase [Deltaproteobacteria bacterium]MBW2111790.1 amidase [Deltaproteobacteria bacterium]MBW2351911.1 amidase [Deltaproteobacteria bacterium]
MTSIHYRSALELAGLIRSGDLSPVELMEETLKRIESVNRDLNAFVALRREEAMEEARVLGERLAAGGDPGPLAGIPVGVKDLEDVEGMVTSFGSTAYRNNRAREDSVQVARLRRAGAIVVGKTNTPEFGFTGFTRNRLYGVTRNPWNMDRTPGGSSGGAAAAVASGMVPLATGSDAGGSIRIPASYSGCFGIKPTFGRIPFGPAPLLPMTRTWTLGPLTRTVADAALYLDCAAGYDPADPASLPGPRVSFLRSLEDPLPELRIGFSPTLGYARVQGEVMTLVEKAAGSFEQMGHRVEIWEGELPDVSGAWSHLMNLELFGLIRRDLDRIRPELGHTLLRSLNTAPSLSVNDLLRIQEVRTRLNRVLWEYFDGFDLLLTPTMPTVAFAAKGPPPAEIDGHPIPLLGAVAFTYPFNLSGHPAATIRAGLTESGLPVGLQIVGPMHGDDLVLRAARAYERSYPWNETWPEI